MSLLRRRLERRAASKTTLKRTILYDRGDVISCLQTDQQPVNTIETSDLKPTTQLADHHSHQHQWLASRQLKLDHEPELRSKQTLRAPRNEATSQQPDGSKIFIISTSSLPLRTFLFTSLTITLGLVICFILSLVANSGPWTLVEAQQNSAPSIANRGHNAEPTNQSGRYATQATRAPNSRNRGSNTNSGDDDEDEDMDSIDRFDLGEQISAPLLKPPTTLAPAQSTTNTRRSFTENNNNNNNQHQTAPIDTSEASQDSTYLSPEEREQLMRSQEAHYGGASSGADEGPNDGGGEQPMLQQTASYNNRIQRPARRQQLQEQQRNNGGSNNNNELASLEPQEGEDWPGDSADDGALEPDQGRQLIPGPRRSSSNGSRATNRVGTRRSSAGRENSSSSRRLAASRAGSDNRPSNGDRNNQLDETDGAVAPMEQPNSDDYSGGGPSEEAHFSRRPPSSRETHGNQHNSQHSNRNQLNLAASNNRQQANKMMLAARRTQNDRDDARANLAEQRENAELAMVNGGDLSGELAADRWQNAEVGRGRGAGIEGSAGSNGGHGLRGESTELLRGNQLDSNGEPDDDDDDDINSAGPGAGSEDSDSAPPSGMADELKGGSNQADNGPGVADSSASPDNYAAAASSSHTKPTSVNQHNHNFNDQQQQQHIESMRQTPSVTGRLVHSFSAPINANPNAAYSNRASLNLSAGGVEDRGAQIRQQAADQWNQARLFKNPHLLLQAAIDKQQQQQQTAKSGSSHQQPAGKPTSVPHSNNNQVPYNPQNNPSHKGKYFIN